MTDYTRITGLASGMDTENMIKDLMKAENLKKDNVESERKLLEWEKEEYQKVSKMLREYRNSYFDLLSPSTNFRSASMFAEFDSTVSSTAVEVSGTSDLSSLNHTIDYITQLATKDEYTSTNKIKESLVGSTVISGASVDTINTSISAGNDTFVMKFDGTSKNITLNGGYSTIDDNTAQSELIADLQNQIDTAFGTGKIVVGLDASNQLEFNASESGHQTSVIESDVDILDDLGLTSGDTDYLKSTTTLAEAFSLSGSIDLTINGNSDFGIEATDTIKEMMDKINASSAEVDITYSELSGKFQIKSNETGEINKISFVDTSNLLSSMNIDISGTTGYIAAQDAIFSIDEVETSRSNNDFTIDGANYSLKETSATAIDISLSPDTDNLIEKIVGFVDKYNEIIKTINDKLDEKRYYDYDPLTAEEKEAMTDEDIELWEEKARSGLLSNSNELERISSDLRVMIYEPIEGLDISLKDIGIKTSSNYLDNGKLLIDEDQLKESINNNYDKVVDLFTKKSDIDYNDTANRSQRISEEGIANRLYDVLQDAVRNERDTNGNKGTLIEKAGYVGEVSDFNNVLDDRIDDYDDRIDDLIDYLADRENYYYQMFAQMEKAMTEMQTQSSWLSSQMG